MPYGRRRRRSNPPTTTSFYASSGATAKALKKIANVLRYSKAKFPKELQQAAGVARVSLDPESLFDFFQGLDPSMMREDRFQGAYLKYIIDLFGRDPIKTLEDNDTLKTMLDIVYTYQNLVSNQMPEWAKVQVTIKEFPTIQALTKYLVDVGAYTAGRASDDYMDIVYDLQAQGQCQVLFDNNDIALIDIITEQAACSLGADTQWCTAQGAFNSYRSRGLVIMYFYKDGHRIQFTPDFEEVMDETDNPVLTEDDLGKEWPQPYSYYLAEIEEVAEVVETRLETFEGVLFPLSAYLQSPNSSKWKVIKEYYPGLPFLPIAFIQKHKARLVNLLSNKGSAKKLQQDFNFLVRTISSEVLALECLALRSPIIAASDLFSEMVTIPKSTVQAPYKFQDEYGVVLDSFEIGKYAVTNSLWVYVMGASAGVNEKSSSFFDYVPLSAPKTDVNWYECVAFCNQLSKQMNLKAAYYTSKGKDYTLEDAKKSLAVQWDYEADGYRLPTEAEWEVAARGGYPNIEKKDYTYAGSDDPDEVAWYSDNADGRKHPVGQKKPNKFGLYDMSGNVFEWVFDGYGDIDDKTTLGEDELVVLSSNPRRRRRRR